MTELITTMSAQAVDDLLAAQGFETGRFWTGETFRFHNDWPGLQITTEPYDDRHISNMLLADDYEYAMSYMGKLEEILADTDAVPRGRFETAS